MTQNGRNHDREMIAVISSGRLLDQATKALEADGFPPADINLVASAETVEKHLGHRYRAVETADPAAGEPRVAFVARDSTASVRGMLATLTAGVAVAGGAIVASGGALAALLGTMAVAGGSGAVLSTGLAELVGRETADQLQQRLEAGDILLCVRTPDADAEKRAGAILERHSSDEVHTHALPAAA
jgi:hypothetical protein